MTSTTTPAAVSAVLNSGGVVDGEADETQRGLAQADAAIAAKDGKGAAAVLGAILATARADDVVAAVVDRIGALMTAMPGEHETALGLLTRAEERAQGAGLDRRILLARAGLHEAVGHHEAALATLTRAIKLVDDDVARAHTLERMGDLARGLNQAQQALIHYQGAFRADRQRTSATRKAIAVYFELGREEQAKQIVDVLAEQVEAGGGVDVVVGKELADLYLRAAEALLVRPQSHAVAKDALDRAARVGPELPRTKTLRAELDAFPQAWKDHVRRLRDSALDARDKRDAARRYLAIAQIYAAYAAKDPQIEQNIEKCLLLAPGYRPAIKFLETLYREEGRLNELIERAKKLAEGVRDPAVAVDLWLFVAVLLAERGASPEELADAYERVRRLDPRNVAAIHALTELHLEHGRYDKAAVVMEAFVGETGDTQAKKQTLRQLARLYELELNDLPKAAARLEQLRALGDGEDDAALHHLVEIYERLDDAPRLADALEAAARPKRQTLDSAALAQTLERLRGLYSGVLASPEKAFHAGRRLFVLQPRAPLEAELLRLADALARGADLATTLLEAAQRNASAGESRRLRLRAAELFLGVGDRRRARALLDQLLEADPSDAGATALVDVLLAKDASPEEHQAILESRLRIQTDPSEQARTLLALADVHLRQRRVDDAIGAVEAALDKDAGNRAALEKLEGLLRQQERFADVATCLERRIRLEDDLNDAAAADVARLRLARLLDERLDRGADAAALFLRLHESLPAGDPSRVDVVRALERLAERGVAAVAVAEVLQPHYAAVGNWRKHVEMIALRHGGEAAPGRRAALARAMAGVFEAQLTSPREAFDAWCDVIADDVDADDALVELRRLADLAQAHARYAEVLGTTAQRLPDGAKKSSLLAERAALLQGVLGDQEAAIAAHQALLASQPKNLESLEQLAGLFEARGAWSELRDVLARRLDVVVDAGVAARLGLLEVQRFEGAGARGHLEQALGAQKPVGGDLRTEVLQALAGLLRREDDAEALAAVLGDLAGELTGAERAAVRAELGDVLRLRLRRYKDALFAYDAAIANDADNGGAWEGVRGVLDEEGASAPERQTAGRLLVQHAESKGNHALKGHALQALYALEPNLQARRALVAQLATVLVEDLDAPDDALDTLLRHLEGDPDDDPVRRQAEAVAAGLARADDLFALYRRLRAVDDRAIGSLYAKRLAELCSERGDHDGAIEAWQFVAALVPQSAEPWQRIFALAERKNDPVTATAALDEISKRAEGRERIERLLELADYAFDTLEDDQRGFVALREAHLEEPDDDNVLLRLEARLRVFGVEGAELATVLWKRANLQAQPAARAALLCEHGALVFRLGDPQTAVSSLLLSLRAERDGQSTLRVTELLQKIAVKDDDAGLAALDAIIEHHRAQKAWQPLVESLEIAAQKRPVGEERAVLFDEISDLNERALRVPQLAFMATCRALRDVPSDARLKRARALAEATGNWSDLLEVCEDVAEAGVNAQNKPLALGFLLHAADIADRLHDDTSVVRIAEAILVLDPQNTGALGKLEAIHREASDQQGLIEVLHRRIAMADNDVARRAALIELARLVAVVDDAACEAALGRVVAINENDVDALKMLDELYERTGNSAAHVVVLERRAQGETQPAARSSLRVRLGLLRLRRRGDPAGAFDDLIAAAQDAPKSTEVRAGVEVLLEHARARGAPPIAAVAKLQEEVLRAQGDFAALPPILELRLAGESDRTARAILLAEIAKVQEHLGNPALAFMAICRAVKEVPDEASLRAEAERLAVATDNLEALALVYEDVLDAVRDPATRVLLHKRIATLAETVSGDADGARQRLVAAVQAGANDVDTLRELVRLTRDGVASSTAKAQDLSSVLLRLAEAAVLEADVEAAKEAYAELADVDENLGNLDGAIRASRELMAIDPTDRGVRTTLERLLSRADRWIDVVELLQQTAQRAQTPEEAAAVLSRQVHAQLDKLRDFPGALATLRRLTEAMPTSEAILALGARALVLLAGDGRPEARQWRADLASMVEPRYESQGAWAELAPVLRLRLDVETRPAERKALWLRVIDIEERLLNKPELAMVSLTRALTEDPADTSLRERAERLSVRLHDLESLLGMYEDLIVRLQQKDPLRMVYATRCAELYEGGIGDPSRAAELYELAFVAVVAQDGGSPERLKLLERVERLYRAVGDPPRLASALKRRADLLDATSARQQLFEAASIEMHGLQDYGAAIATLKRLLELHPSDVPALRALGEACERQSRWGDLAETLERELAALGTSDVTRSLQARHRLGVVLDKHLELADEAMVHFQAVLDVKPDYADTRRYLEERRMAPRSTGRFDGAAFLQQSYEKTGDWQKAVDVLQGQVADLERRGDKREIRLHLTRIADLQEQKLQQPDLAFVTLCRALKHDPGDLPLRQRLKNIAVFSDVVDDLCEVFEDEALAAEVSGRGALAAELREDAASLYADAMGDLARAIAAYEAILEKNPGRLVPLEQLSLLYPRVGRYADLEKALRRRLMFKDEPRDRVPLLVELGQVLADKLDRPDDAVPLLSEVRKLDPQNAPARRLLIELFDGQGNLAPLRTLLDEEIINSAAVGDLAGASTARRRLATLLADQLDDVDAAIPLWVAVRAEQETKTAGDVSFATLERLYNKAERFPELRDLYEEALRVEREPTLISSLTSRLGDVLSRHLGGKDEAVSRHLKVLELDPQNVTSLDALRQLYFDLARYDELVALLRRMMRTTGEARRLKDLRFQLAEVLGAKLNKRAEAVETGRRILDIEPHAAGELERLAGVFRACEAWEELAEVLERHAAQLDGPARAARLLEIADVFENNLNRGRLAAPAYEKILAVDPRHVRAYERLCAIYSDNADWPRLVALKDERTKKSPDSVERVLLLREIGAIYEEKMGQKSMAFLAACRAFPEDYDSKELADWVDRLALETDSVDELITFYDDALGHISNESRILAIHLRMAELAWKHMQAPADAELHFKRVLEYDARNDRALDGLAALFESLQRWRDVVGVYERRVEQAPDVAGRVDWLRRIAKLYDQKARDVDAAISAFKRITEIDGTNAQAMKELAELLEREMRWPALVAVLKRSEELAPSTEERLAIRYRTAGIWEQQLENPDQAIATFKSILDEDSAHVLALKALERLFTSLNRPEELLRVFGRMVQLAPTGEEAVRLLGKIAAVWEESFEDLRAAVQSWERVLQVDRQNVPAVKNLERLLQRLSEWELLVQAYELHISLTREPKEIVQLYLQIGEVQAKELGRTDKAEAVYNAALDFDPGNKDAVHALGSLYEKSGNWFNALEKLQQEAQLKGVSPEAVEIYYRIGKINEDMLLDQGNALIAYRAALQIEPSHLPSIQALKLLAAQRGEHQEQLKWLRTEAQYTKEDAAKTAAHTATGVFLQDTLSDLEGASEEFERALTITYDHLAAAKPLADISFRDENWNRAEQLLDIIVERLDPNTEATELCRQHYRLGYVCEKLAKEQKALKNYQRAYEIDSTYLPALEGLGAALSRAGRWDDTSKIYQAVLIHHRDGLTDAEIVDYYQQLADLNHKLVQSDRALKNLEKALELDQNHGPSLRLMATVFEAEQRFEDAYEAMIRLVPHVGGEERVRLLVEIGRLAKSELDDPYRAIDAYEDANRQRPGDPDILKALLQLYRQTRQGPRAVEILEELVRVEADEKERVRLNQTLGEVWRDELKNDSRAAQYFNAALDLDPNFVKAFESLEQLLSSTSNWAGLEENYIAMLKRLPQADPKGIKGVLWRNLGDLYRYKLKNLEGATQAYKVLAKMTPDDVGVLEILADLLSKAPAQIDDAILTWQRLAMSTSTASTTGPGAPPPPDRLNRALHELVRLYLAKKLADRAYLATAALKAMNDAHPQEQQLFAAYQKEAPAQAKRAMTDKLWDLLLVHPAARGPLAQLSTILWRSAGSALMRSQKDYGFDKKKLWEKKDLDAPVPMYFVTQLKYVRGVLNVGAFELWEKQDGAEALAPLALETPTLAIGKAHPLLRDTNARLMWFQIARQVSGLRPAFMLPRALGASRFNALVDVSIKLVEPRYPVRGDPKEIAEVEKALLKIAAPLANALRPVVGELLKSKQQVSTKAFLEGMEHTALRTGYLITGDLELAMAIAKQPDGAIPLPFAQKLRELLLFSVSEEHFELRQRLGTAIGLP
jgi:tetratricopeptide (TPR) repeat protein